MDLPCGCPLALRAQGQHHGVRSAEPEGQRKLALLIETDHRDTESCPGPPTEGTTASHDGRMEGQFPWASPADRIEEADHSQAPGGSCAGGSSHETGCRDGGCDWETRDGDVVCGDWEIHLVTCTLDGKVVPL